MYSFFSKLKLVSRSYSNQLHQELAPYNITEVQWGLIRYIYESGPSTFTDVAAYWQVEKPSITPIAQKLIEQELIHVLSGKDKRQKVMHLTTKGVEKYDQLKQVIDSFQEEMVEGITSEERGILERAFGELFKSLRKRG